MVYETSDGLRDKRAEQWETGPEGAGSECQWL